MDQRDENWGQEDEPIVRRLRDEKPQASALELDKMKTAAMAKAKPSRSLGAPRSRIAAALLTVGLMAAGTAGTVAATDESSGSGVGAARAEYKPCDDGSALDRHRCRERRCHEGSAADRHRCREELEENGERNDGEGNGERSAPVTQPSASATQPSAAVTQPSAPVTQPSAPVTHTVTHKKAHAKRRHHARHRRHARHGHRG